MEERADTFPAIPTKIGFACPPKKSRSFDRSLFITQQSATRLHDKNDRSKLQDTFSNTGRNSRPLKRGKNRQKLTRSAKISSYQSKIAEQMLCFFCHADQAKTKLQRSNAIQTLQKERSFVS
ncbi:hypothetical protein GAO09_27280 [Rhizobiales bacterium RZME27]|jgi:hypothetical protein|uniref:Uncharacterized protein n=1 Tax=Endobacterium cereale TaxID=2663029 RepID=A0A6A8AFZ6_9HYPH|nr:hypothetical protein [Endobacterium cereale]MEB2843012.1 hypothetical protein [Endobacterium cereale]MQY49734.1 hypothetical protein [Endobacterium cereale]